MRSATATERLLAALVAALFSVLALGVGAVPVGAQGDSGPPTTLVPIEEQTGQGRPSIIPTPSMADAEIEPGQPGSPAQYAVLFGTMAGMVGIVLLVRRESRRKAANRTPQPS